MMTELGNPKNYRLQGKRYLAQAAEELSAGDTQQASEKAWGAVASMIKAAADQRGISHGNHRKLRQALRDVVEETGDAQLTLLISHAEALHANFYEGFLSETEVHQYLAQVSEFVERMDRHIGAE